MKITCLDDSNRPNEIKISNWIKKGDKYTPVKVVKELMSDKQYFVLEEVQPDLPYGGYDIRRFGISPDEIKKLVEEEVLEEELV